MHWAGYAGGHLSAATGLVEDGVRWLNPATGDWLSQDPAGFGGNDANLSRYVGNNVTNAIDPTGLSATGAFGMTYSTFQKGGTVYSQFVTFGDAGGVSGLNCVQMPMGWTTLPDMHFGNQLTFATNDGSTVAPGTAFAYSYLTGRIELFDPHFAENADAAMAEATMVANQLVLFYAMAPLVCTTAPITGFTKHGINGAISHAGGGVPPAIMYQTVTKPLQIILQPNGNYKIVGQYAVVVLNQAGLVVTTYLK